MERLNQIIEKLLQWYPAHCRELPWRKTVTPYRVWVSEIMLQQTRVEAVRGYFERFISRFPTIQSLAKASEEELMKYWEGLGYYSRVRNMQKAALTIMSDYGGVIPSVRRPSQRLRRFFPRNRRLSRRRRPARCPRGLRL